MSSSGGGIVVHPFGNPNDKVIITKADGQTICDALTAAGHTALAAQIQPIVNDAT